MLPVPWPDSEYKKLRESPRPFQTVSSCPTREEWIQSPEADLNF